jgi:hypothetical protein
MLLVNSYLLKPLLCSPQHLYRYAGHQNKTLQSYPKKLVPADDRYVPEFSAKLMAVLQVTILFKYGNLILRRDDVDLNSSDRSCCIDINLFTS